MKILVCAKVCDGELNPFDQSALEMALSMENSCVTLLCMGPQAWADILRPATRLGVKRVILLSDRAYAGSDTLATSYVLSQAIQKLSYDLIICGRKTLDGETAQVGPCLSAMLGIPVITNVFDAQMSGDSVVCKTEAGTEKTKLPALLTVERTKQLRFPSIFSNIGEIEIWTNNELCADISKCGLSGSPTKVLQSYESVKGERTCSMISPSECLPLIQKLFMQQKQQRHIKESDTKLASVWAIGNEVYESARAIAKHVVLLPKDTPQSIAGKAIEKKPEVILWNADFWGRRNAPIVQALLQTGLCADCTELETDGTRLYMIRPARGGNVTAKIQCDAYPQMATVRTTDLCDSELIVSAGRGVADQMDAVKKFADSLGARLCASRGLVDMGKLGYEAQVGLTGKLVSPKIYIAIGISGAVHHTVGIKDADVVIAINPDKNARIFNFADYGVVCTFETFLNMI